MTLHGWQVCLGAALSSGFGAFISPYLGAKGKNLATKEDFQQLLLQLEANTEATKSIEGRISDEFWNKQRLWELKRDILLEVMTALGMLDDSILSIAAANSLRAQGSPEEEILKAQVEANDEFLVAWRKFVGTRNRALLTCDSATGEILMRAQKLIWKEQGKLRTAEKANYGEISANVQVAIDAVIETVRREMGVLATS